MRDDNREYRKLFVGVDTEIQKEDGSKIVPINFDNAATTPAFKLVKGNVIKYMETYGSIGRGSGLKSIETTATYEFSRNVVLDFFNVKDDGEYTVIYVKNTTEGINLLANILIDNKEEKVLATRMEHHANDLPWRNVAQMMYLETDEDGKLNYDNLDNIIKENNIKVVTITAASNVTGYINPINKIAKIAHENGAMIVVDAAQIIAHSKIEISPIIENESIDFLVFSGHKMYSPMGTGVIIARKSLIKNKKPFLRGGGAVNIVFDNEEYWGEIPEKYEAGTPNFFGVVGIVSSIIQLKELGMENIGRYEDALKKYLFAGVRDIKNIREYGCRDCENRLSLLSINADGKDHRTVAKELSDIRGIAVRSGCFCAHSYVKRLLGLKDQDTKKYLYDENLERPGLVRISLGLYNSIDEIDEFLNVLEDISESKNKIIY
ncbi:aminotransferase class V-fold PLP-dependent enzyme [uncultured Clostridium sp.]|uniref:aminotransferase class V-fold PLP-dependent enzyme n=1 Tax=uncultured Clostridium sp. TaxID=59620 RepID=UPI00262420F9|nr:aminotransferase class V-fold PLP-dependent enzyme [uncultured Clostridium sp.]